MNSIEERVRNSVEKATWIGAQVRDSVWESTEAFTRRSITYEGWARIGFSLQENIHATLWDSVERVTAEGCCIVI